MKNLYLCKLNLESVISSLAEKYMKELNLILMVYSIQPFSVIAVILEIVTDILLKALMLLGRSYPAK